MNAMQLRSASQAALATLEERHGSDHAPARDVISFHSLLAGPPSKLMPAPFVPFVAASPVPHDIAELAAEAPQTRAPISFVDFGFAADPDELPPTLRESGIFPSNQQAPSSQRKLG